MAYPIPESILPPLNNAPLHSLGLLPTAGRAPMLAREVPHDRLRSGILPRHAGVLALDFFPLGNYPEGVIPPEANVDLDVQAQSLLLSVAASGLVIITSGLGAGERAQRIEVPPIQDSVTGAPLSIDMHNVAPYALRRELIAAHLERTWQLDGDPDFALPQPQGEQVFSDIYNGLPSKNIAF